MTDTDGREPMKCAACGILTDAPYCLDCELSGQAAYDRADRVGDPAARAMCAACGELPEAERGDGSAWSCGVCGRDCSHGEGVHTVQYGTYHEFVCWGCEGLVPTVTYGGAHTCGSHPTMTCGACARRNH